MGSEHRKLFPRKAMAIPCETRRTQAHRMQATSVDRHAATTIGWRSARGMQNTVHARKPANQRTVVAKEAGVGPGAAAEEAVHVHVALWHVRLKVGLGHVAAQPGALQALAGQGKVARDILGGLGEQLALALRLRLLHAVRLDCTVVKMC